MKHLKKFQDISFEVEDTGKSSSYTSETAKKIHILDNGENKGYAIVIFRDKVFSYWDLHEELDGESIPDAKTLYIIGIQTKRGYGSKLMDRVEQYARENDCEYVTLGSITEALGFWKKIGYTVYSLGEYYSMYKKL